MRERLSLVGGKLVSRLVPLTNAALRARPNAPGRFTNAFAVSHGARCGSTVLGGMLAQHPQVRYDGETFGRYLRAVERGERAAGKTASDLLRDEAPLVRRSQRFGFDYHRGDLLRMRVGHREMLEQLEAFGVARHILLKRENLLAREVSANVARAIGRWHLRAGESPPGPLRVPLDVEGHHQPQLLDRLRALGDYFDAVEQELRTRRGLVLTYEQDVCLDPRVGYRKLMTFLDLPHHDAAIENEKINKRELHEVISNFAAVERHLAGTEFEWMLRG